jgi:uncharacterized protein (TIGR02466 family)
VKKEYSFMKKNIRSLFPTLVYRAEALGVLRLNAEIEVAALALAQDDRAGQRWCEQHGYPGYTSYGSHNDLSWRMPPFKTLEKLLTKHANEFAKALNWDLRGGRLLCDSLWVNVMPEGGHHTGHIHRNSVISGTYYVKVPKGACPIMFEDPRLAMMMAAPPRKASTGQAMKIHVSETPKAGTVMWESWLRHEVPLNRAAGDRISVSFNYVIGTRKR